MFTNDLCPSCRQIFGNSCSQSSATLSIFIDPRKCSKCDKVFSSMTQANSRQFANNRENAGVQITYFDGLSTWTPNIYQPSPLGMGYYRERLDEVDNSNIVERKRSEVSQTKSVTFSAGTPSNCQPKEVTELNSLTASVEVERCNDEAKFTESDLFQKSSMACSAETESHIQQLTIDLNALSASVEVEGSNDDSKYMEVIIIHGANETATRGQELSSITDDQQSNATKISRFDNEVYLVFCIDTNRRVSMAEINENIESYLLKGSVGVIDGQPFVCQFSSNCHKVFINLSDLSDHLFSHLFFIYCTKCKLKFNHLNCFDKHLTTCKEIPKKTKTKSTVYAKSSTSCSIAAPGDIQVQQDAESPRKIPFWAKFFDSNQSVYRRNSAIKVPMDELMDQISKNYAIHLHHRRLYFCLLEHYCQKSYSTFETIANHLFGHFFIFRCPHCSKELYSFRNIRQHSKFCAEKTDQVVVTSESKTRRGKHSKQVYRCLYCDYECEPGGVRRVIEHLNGRSQDGIVLPPYCETRRELKPADPETGLYEQLEPVLVRPF